MEWVTPQLNEAINVAPAVSTSLLWPPSDLETATSSAQDDAEIHLSAYLAAKGVEVNSYNDGSIVLLFVFGGKRVLLTGDLEQPIEKALLDAGVMNNVIILKAGHHGSKSSSSQPWVDKLRPEFSVISAAKINKYGHPAPEVISCLEKAGSQIFRTADSGSLVFSYNGQTLVPPVP